MIFFMPAGLLVKTSAVRLWTATPAAQQAIVHPAQGRNDFDCGRREVGLVSSQRANSRLDADIQSAELKIDDRGLRIDWGLAIGDWGFDRR
jgi:hypothetical protein